MYNTTEDLRSIQNILSNIDNHYRDLYVRVCREKNISEGTRKSVINLGNIINPGFIRNYSEVLGTIVADLPPEVES